MGQVMLRMTVDMIPDICGIQLLQHRLTTAICLLPVFFPVKNGQLRGLTKTDDAGDVFRSRPTPLLLQTPVLKGLKGNIASDPEGTHPLGPLILWADTVNRSTGKLFTSIFSMPKAGPHRYGRRPRAPGRSPDFRHWLQCAHFIVSVHDTEDRRLFIQGFPHLFRRHLTRFIHRQPGDTKTESLQKFTGIQDGMVFHPGGDHMIFPLFPECEGDTGQGGLSASVPPLVKISCPGSAFNPRAT